MRIWDGHFILKPFMIVLFNSGTADAAEKEFNRSMSALRVSVEWNYKDIKRKYYVNDMKRLLKFRHAPIVLL